MSEPNAGSEDKVKRPFMENFGKIPTFGTNKQPEETRSTETRGNALFNFSKQVAQAMSGPNRGGSTTPKASVVTESGDSALDSSMLMASTSATAVLPPLIETPSKRPNSSSFTTNIIEMMENEDLRNQGLGEVDITTEDVDFDGMDEDLRNFHQNTVVKDALAKGVNLREYAKQIENDLRTAEKESIQDYIHESDHLATLHQEIQVCETILTKMENMLSTFQSNLGNISIEIKQLQDESQSMNMSLSNRKKVEEDLVHFIERLAIPKSFIKLICESPIDSTYVEGLKKLDEKLKFCSSADSKATREVLPELEKLKMRASAKNREHILGLLDKLRRPNINIHEFQNNSLLSSKYLCLFLSTHHPEYAKEIQDTYADIMSKHYLAVSRKYLTAVSKTSVEVISRTDLIGSEESHFKSFISGKTIEKGKHTAFALNGRDKVINEKAIDITSPTAASALQKHPYEVAFKSIQSAFLDSAIKEYTFIMQLFGQASFFTDVFGKSIAAYQDYLRDYLPTSFDCISIFLMICIMHDQQQQTSGQGITVLNSYFDGSIIQLWTRFKIIFDLNMDSVKTLQPRSIWKNDTSVHHIVKKYGDFAASLLSIKERSNNEGMLLQNIRMFQKEMDKLLLKTSELFPVKKHQTIFLINNYDAILMYMEDASVSQHDAKLVSDQLSQYTSKHAEDELRELFGPLIDYVMVVEPLSATSVENAVAKIPDSRVQQLVKEFAATWTKNIERLSSTTQQHFPNPKNSAEVLGTIFTQLISYYTRFFNLVRKLFPKEAFVRELIPTNSVAFEARKHHRTTA